MKTNLLKVVSLAIVVVMLVAAFAACAPEETPVTPAVFKQAEYNTTTSVMPTIKLLIPISWINSATASGRFACFIIHAV